MEDEIEEIFQFMLLMHEETKYSKFSVNKEKAKNQVAFCIDNGFCYFDKECLMLGKAFFPWLSDDLCAADVLLYTKAESRGKGLAKKAVKAYIEWAEKIGAIDIKIGQSTGTTEKEFNKLADSLGLKKIGALYNV